MYKAPLVPLACRMLCLPSLHMPWDWDAVGRLRLPRLCTSLVPGIWDDFVLPGTLGASQSSVVLLFGVLCVFWTFVQTS